MHGKNYYPSKMQALLLFDKNEVEGFLFYDTWCQEYEIIVFEVFKKFQGLGTRLLNAFIEIVKNAGGKKVHVMTTNDSIDALRFYQRRGFVIVGIGVNVIAEARERKPTIAMTGDYGIPLRDEILMELNLI